MTITAVITEYNPFHNGHLYHLQEARRLTQADYMIVVMSGNFVQRGEPAIIDKYTRTQMALSAGADLVLELPVYYATGSAEYFAAGAISLLCQLNCVDFLCFGSECADISKLNWISDILAKEPKHFQTLLQNYQKQGLSFPASREKALVAYAQEQLSENVQRLSSILKTPNNILAIEYLKALKQQKSNIQPIAILRKEAGYHDKTISNDTKFASASAIRQAIYNKQIEKLTAVMPDFSCSLLQPLLEHHHFVSTEDLSALLNYRKLLLPDYSIFYDMTTELANRLESIRTQPMNYLDTCAYLKTKQYTYARISRCLLHLLLDIKDEDISLLRGENLTPYGRILGFQRTSSALLSELKKQSSIPLITKTAAAKLSSTAAVLFKADIQASHIYNQLLFQNSHMPVKNEWSHGIILI